MKKSLWISAISALMMAGAVVAKPVKVHTIGDSTMANYSEDRVTRGWAQFLQQFFNPDAVTVNNRGKAGASSKSFYQESAYWQSVKKQMAEGDYVLIQFAHNDEKNGGMDGDSLKAYYTRVGNTAEAASTDYRGTTPYDTYKKYLEKYVDETRAAGCNPVLVGPICRMYIENNGNSIKRSGQHDLGDNYQVLTPAGPSAGEKLASDDHKMDYVYAMQQVAKDKNVPFVNLTEATRDLYVSYGTKCQEMLSDHDGATHLNSTGAALIARLAAGLLKDANILADAIQVSADLSVNPSSADFGEAYKGQTLTKEFSLSGFSLTPAEGAITVTATDGIKLSTDKVSWSNSITLNYQGGTIVAPFYGQVVLDGDDAISGTITVVQGDKKVEVPVSAKAVSLEGGTDVKAYWRLESDDSYTLEGPANVIPESWSGMYVQRYANPNKNTIWPAETGFDATRKTQRNLITGDAWPAGEIDEVSTRYIQFGITPSKGTTLKIDSIGMYVCGCGGNGMRAHINYSTKPDFAEDVNFFAPEKMPANEMLPVSVQPVITLNEGDTLRVRVYPWYGSAATGKTICLSDVTIHGKAMDATPTGITTVNGAMAIQDDKWYNLQGQRVADPRKGVYICNGKKYVIK